MCLLHIYQVSYYFRTQLSIFQLSSMTTLYRLLVKHFRLR